jgi:hypothetical protein
MPQDWAERVSRRIRWLVDTTSGIVVLALVLGAIGGLIRGLTGSDAFLTALVTTATVAYAGFTMHLLRVTRAQVDSDRRESVRSRIDAQMPIVVVRRFGPFVGAQQQMTDGTVQGVQPPAVAVDETVLLRVTIPFKVHNYGPTAALVSLASQLTFGTMDNIGHGTFLVGPNDVHEFTWLSPLVAPSVWRARARGDLTGDVRGDPESLQFVFESSPPSYGGTDVHMIVGRLRLCDPDGQMIPDSEIYDGPIAATIHRVYVR